MMPLIETQKLQFAYNSAPPILESIDFSLDENQRIGIIGGNGCGKTTFLHLLVGLLKPKSGTITAFGKPRVHETDFHEMRLKTGLVFQHADDQLFCPTVLEDIAFGPLNQKKSADEAKAIAIETLETLGLKNFESRITYNLSGGEKRMVALATVLAMQPKILLLDEPTTGLDKNASRQVLDTLSALDQAMIVVSHNPQFIDEITTSVLTLDSGKLQPA